MRVRGALGEVVARARALLDAGRDVVVEVRGPLHLGEVDLLARLLLVARRCDRRLEVQTDDDGLLELTGLSGVLRGDPVRQPEAGEQRGVEEVVDVDQLAP